MKVQLVTSPHIRHPAVLQSDFQVDQSVMNTFIPIGLLSLISSARLALNIEPFLYDLNRRIIDGTIGLGSNFYENASAALCSSGPDLIGFMTESDSYHHVLQICERIKEMLPGCLIVLGGPHASAVSKRTLQRYSCVDFIVQGEGEVTFAELLRSIMSGSKDRVAGVVQRNKKEEPGVETGIARPQVGLLDSLPFPAYDLYRPDPGEEIFLEVGRGCPFQCTFCSTAPFWKRQHRVKSPARILAEINHLTMLYGPRRMHFTHDLFTVDRAWVRDVCKTLIDSGSPARWTCSSRTDTIDEELLHLMATAGCSAIYFGLESGSEQIVRDVGKNIPKAHSFRMLKACLDAGITPNAGFIGGLPSEDEESLEETFTAYTQALELGCNPVHLFLFTPYADSSIFNSLGQTICTGHFLDLPLGHELDISNRELIASDPVLFGAYHRPRHSCAREVLFDALEEFGTLVASALLPTLVLARHAGGMFHLFEQWIEWVGSFNINRGAEPFRRYCASAARFCDFLMDLATKYEGVPPHLHSLLRVVQMNHLLTGSIRIPTTMASYRTKMASTEMQLVNLGSKLSIGNVVATLEVEHDVSAAFSNPAASELPVPRSGPLYLVWHRDSTGYMQLIKVDAFTFQAVQILRLRPKATADVIVESLLNSGKARVSGDFSELLCSLTDAAKLGIITQDA